jgi:hypothetical protein
MALLKFGLPKRGSGDDYNRMWKATYNEDTPSIEIRKSFYDLEDKETPYTPDEEKRWGKKKYHSDVMLVVRKDGVAISMNQKTGLTLTDADDLQKAIAEAREILISGRPPIEYTEKQLKALESKANKAREEADKLEKELKEARNKYA